MKKFLLIALLGSTLLSASAQFGSNTYGGETDPSTVVGGRYANTAAYFDSTGTLRGGTGGLCSTCAQPTSLLSKTVLLNSSQILDLYSVPDTLLPAAPQYYTYNVVSGYASINYNSIAYAGDSILTLKINGSPVAAFGNNGVVNATSNITQAFNISVGTGKQYFPSGEPLLISTLHQNVTAGNSTIRVTVYYTLLYTGIGTN